MNISKRILILGLISTSLYFAASAVLAKETHKGAPASAHHEVQGISPEQATKWLKNGNERYLTGRIRKDGQSKADIEKLSKGQQPHTMVLSCSDSRVPPELVFDQRLGELFVVRTAGEALDPNAIGSLEYAIEHLGARHLLVMGHTSCGAVKAAFDTLGGADAGSPSLNKLVADIHPRIAEFKGKEKSHNVEMETWANAKGVAKDLISRSEIIAQAVKSGKVKISTSVYYLDNGKVKFE